MGREPADERSRVSHRRCGGGCHDPPSEPWSATPPRGIAYWETLHRIVNNYKTRASLDRHLDQHAGAGTARMLTCDLSTEYVRFNAEYTT